MAFSLMVSNFPAILRLHSFLNNVFILIKIPYLIGVMGIVALIHGATVKPNLKSNMAKSQVKIKFQH